LSMFALALYVAITAVVSLLGYSEPKPTLLGIATLVAAAAIVMPWLAKEKRRLSGATGSAALRADAAQSACVLTFRSSPWRDWLSAPSGA
jgi:divalent metal cation (Fe/Co/Zn/Cd) transporter